MCRKEFVSSGFQPFHMKSNELQEIQNANFGIFEHIIISLLSAQLTKMSVFWTCQSPRTLIFKNKFSSNHRYFLSRKAKENA